MRVLALFTAVIIGLAGNASVSLAAITCWYNTGGDYTGSDDADTRFPLVSIREHLESLESLVIRLRRSDSQEPGDVDEREPWSV